MAREIEGTPDRKEVGFEDGVPTLEYVMGCTACDWTHDFKRPPGYTGPEQCPNCGCKVMEVVG